MSTLLPSRNYTVTLPTPSDCRCRICPDEDCGYHDDGDEVAAETDGRCPACRAELEALDDCAATFGTRMCDPAVRLRNAVEAALWEIAGHDEPTLVVCDGSGDVDDDLAPLRSTLELPELWGYGNPDTVAFDFRGAEGTVQVAVDEAPARTLVPVDRAYLRLQRWADPADMLAVCRAALTRSLPLGDLIDDVAERFAPEAPEAFGLGEGEGARWVPLLRAAAAGEGAVAAALRRLAAAEHPADEDIRPPCVPVGNAPGALIAAATDPQQPPLMLDGYRLLRTALAESAVRSSPDGQPPDTVALGCQPDTDVLACVRLLADRPEAGRTFTAAVAASAAELRPLRQAYAATVAAL